MARVTGFTKTSLTLAALVASAGSAAAIDVREIGSFYVGGQSVTLKGLPPRQIVTTPGQPAMKVDPNGDFHTGQMYVQFIKLEKPQAKYPLLLWHTGGITGASWETKPDGQPGWMHYFMKQGHDVYVSDAVERGRATFSRFPEIYRTEPIFRDKREAWEIFRIGKPGSYATDPAQRKENEGQLFPLAAFDTMQMQMAPRWPTNGEATQAAYNALVQRVCPCVIMAHGQAGLFAFQAALAAPDKVKGIAAIEPAFAPKPYLPEITKMKAVPHIFVWGDYTGTNPVWVDHLKELKPYFYAVKAQGGSAEWFDLPEAGIKGNTHMIMWDSNSDLVAGRLQSWFVKNKLMGPPEKGMAASGARSIGSPASAAAVRSAGRASVQRNQQ